MTLIDLFQQRQSDEEFVGHPDVRRAYWRAIDSTEQYYDSARLPELPPLLEAVEELRKAVINNPRAAVRIGRGARQAVAKEGDPVKWAAILLTEPLDTFVLRLAALTEEE